MPLQHAHPKCFKTDAPPGKHGMGLQHARKNAKSPTDLALRSTFIVGYPGETEQEFEKLINFLKEIRFDRVGLLHSPSKKVRVVSLSATRYLLKSNKIATIN